MPVGRDGAASSARTDRSQFPPVVPAKVRVPATDALPRERLETALAEAFGRRLTLLVAPAGSGKTTLLARFAATAGVPVAWYRAEALDRDEGSFVRHLEASLASAIPGLQGGWTTADDAACGLEARPDTSPVLLVVDDFHALEGTDAEAAFGRLVEFAPAWLAPVVATRVAPGLNLTRLRIAGDLLELGSDDLRFRSWEVEQLFRDIYHDPVPPADLAVLARRTEGWAAGLQLFHLATQGRPAAERRRILGGPGSSGRLLRDYLALNVMRGLPAELRSFLVETSVLGRVSGPLCDRLRGAGGSGVMLDELARRGVFTVLAEDDGDGDTYRYHEVLRQYLDRVLVEDIGEAAARSRHATAGRLLEADGALPEALRAYCRAEDWDAVSRLLGGRGEQLAATGAAGWIDALPAAIERHDPWVALAAARRARNDGRFAAALTAYVRAEAELRPARTAEMPRRERLALAAWMDPAAIPPSDASGSVRSGLVREPMASARDALGSDDPAVPVAWGLLALAAGEVGTASRLLGDAADDEAVGSIAAAGARLGHVVAEVLAGSKPDGRGFDRAAEEAERAGVPWLARLARDLGRLLGSGVRESSSLPSVPEDVEPWGAALRLLAAAWAASPGPEAALEPAEAAADRFRRLGAGVLEAWARSLAALASAASDLPDARDAVLAAESLGRATGTPAARVLAHAALARLEDDARSDDPMVAAGSADSGLSLPAWAMRPAPPVDDRHDGMAVDAGRAIVAAPGTGRPGSVQIRMLGGCSMQIDGRRVSLDGARPRVRSLFRLLALQAGGPVHREVIQEALWPDADAAAGARSLHVALSALRRLLDEVAPPTGGRLVVRDGDAYRLDISPEDVDLGRFDRAMAAGRSARSAGLPAAVHFAEAVRLYTGELMPEEGPTEWVAERRDSCRAKAIEAAQSLAEEALLASDYATAIQACRFGLELDRYQDAFWRMLILARERAGEAGAASRDRREYALVLEALGVDVPATFRTA